ncbi:MAG: hypothetical protein C4534_00235 [Gaiellales bacterium]|nr:MAG: hypothetical protein C4534_00235 [Gaiellales bacterium]
MEDEIVIAGSYSSRGEADMLKGMLEAAGIRAEVLSDDAGGLYPQLQDILGVHLVVRREDLQRARELLDGTGGEGPD